MKFKKSLFFFTFFLILIALYLIINSLIGSSKFIVLKNILSSEQKKIIKQIFFPYKYNKQLEKDNLRLSTEIRFLQRSIENMLYENIKPYEIDIEIKNSLKDLVYKKNEIKNLKYKNYKLKKYLGDNSFVTGINNAFPGSGFLEFSNNKLFLASSIGIIAYGKISQEEIIFEQIKNNIEEFINVNQFKKNRRFSIKDLKIINNKIYISYTNEVNKDCWNTSVVYSNLDYSELLFSKLFSPKECVIKEGKEELNGWQSGGRIIKFDEDHIFLSIGDFRVRHLAQMEDSLFGKIVKINIFTKKYETISMGHRNPQGLFFDNKNKYLIETEHGPFGGDEINIIKLNNNNIPNYGWPIASYGEHYGKFEENIDKYKKYPLLKSHKDNGFVEPLHYFIPSIGISEVVGLGDKKYIVSSLKDRSLYLFRIDEKNKIQNLEKIEIGERIRDLILQNDNLILFLEDSNSIGIINLK